ncbi:MAG: choice-of-anchor tandem repeat GloVer-containing protein [Myxococcota bacterium]
MQSDVDDSYRDLYFLDSRGTEGSGVSTALTMGSDGRIYGYTKEEGKNSNGTIFAFEPKEDSSSELEVLYDYTDRFLSRSDVPYPLVEQAGSLYQVYLARAETGTDRRIQVLELDLDTGQVNFPTQSIVGASTEVSGFTMLDDELYLVFDNEIRSYDPASPAGFSLRTTIALTPEPSTGLTGPYRYNPKWTPVAAGSKLCVVMERSHPELAQPEYVMVAYDTIEDRVTTTSLGSAAPTEQVQTDGDSVFVLVGRALQRYDVEQPGVSSVYTFGDARADIGMFAASDGNLYGTTRLVDPQRDDIYRYAPGPDRLQQLHRTTNSIQLGRGGLVEAR